MFLCRRRNKDLCFCIVDFDDVHVTWSGRRVWYVTCIWYRCTRLKDSQLTRRVGEIYTWRPFGLLGPYVGMLILPFMGIRFGEMYKKSMETCLTWVWLVSPFPMNDLATYARSGQMTHWSDIQHSSIRTSSRRSMVAMAAGAMKAARDMLYLCQPSAS